jgi:two-component system cell cycle sensor histidine kinase/response regulator CckA
VSSEPGKGSTFKIYLPVASGAAETPQPARPAHALRGSETVLVVEDQAEVRGLIEKSLGRYGYTVFTATDGAEGPLSRRRTKVPFT